ncbi:MAG: hypothetical protein AAF899_12075 [Pseudomonadota bacterium]
MDVFDPEFTFEPAEGELVEREYRAASRILEYGSGGSTVLAARLGGKALLSVESDPDWASNMQALLEREHRDEDVRVTHVDIGPTREWGIPADHRRTRYLQYLRYSHLAWWQRPIGEPDLVLVDGRFRLACFLATLWHIRRPTRLLFDDYVRSVDYTRAEAYCTPTEVAGRMAVFDLHPTRFMRLRALGDLRQLVNYI